MHKSGYVKLDTLFQKAGAYVCVIDKQEGPHFVGDISDKMVLEQFAKDVISKHGTLSMLK